MEKHLSDVCADDQGERKRAREREDSRFRDSVEEIIEGDSFERWEVLLRDQLRDHLVHTRVRRVVIVSALDDLDGAYRVHRLKDAKRDGLAVSTAGIRVPNLQRERLEVGVQLKHPFVRRLVPGILTSQLQLADLGAVGDEEGEDRRVCLDFEGTKSGEDPAGGYDGDEERFECRSREGESEFGEEREGTSLGDEGSRPVLGRPRRLRGTGGCWRRVRRLRWISIGCLK